MTRLILAGAGGFACEIHEYLRQDIQSGHLRDCEIAGVLDDFPDRYYAHSGLPAPLLGSIDDYRGRDGEAVIIANGTPRHRQRIAARLAANGASFFTYVHSSCYVASTARLGVGVVVCPQAILNHGCRVDDFAVLNVFASAGHGCRIGAYTVLSPYAAVNGDGAVGECGFLGTRATVYPKVTLGRDCTVDTHSFVKASVGDGMIVSNRAEYKVIRNRLI